MLRCLRYTQIGTAAVTGAAVAAVVVFNVETPVNGSHFAATSYNAMGSSPYSSMFVFTDDRSGSRGTACWLRFC